MDRPPRRPLAKVKTGCHTCKRRKVKCDEGRPACTRCLSTGWVCQGYGIWGGGASIAALAAVAGPARSVLLRGTAGPRSPEEHGWLEWFRDRTGRKLKGAYGLPFWDVVVLRAGLEEPSVFHAMLALSALHKRVCSAELAGPGSGPDPARLEQFILSQYNKAIRHLMPSSSPSPSPSPSPSLRVVLVACLLFSCLEVLRGDVHAGSLHLQNGMRLLAQLPPAPPQGQGWDSTDDGLVVAFRRMSDMAAPLGYGRWAAAPLPCGPPRLQLVRLPITFASVEEARRMLDGLFSAVFDLAAQARAAGAAGVASDAASTAAFLSAQRHIQADLALWCQAYHASRVGLNAHMDAVARLGYQLLQPYHAMAGILAATCQQPDDEHAFDAHSAAFSSIIAQCRVFLYAVRAIHGSGDPVFRTARTGLRPGSRRPDLFHADIGWTPLLYFTALHCRIPRVRRQAVALLCAIPCAAGIWDERLAAAVARQVMLIEGTDADTDTADDVPLPASCCRVCCVQVTFPDSCGTAVMTCRRDDNGGLSRAITMEYILTTDKWKDVLPTDVSHI